LACVHSEEHETKTQNEKKDEKLVYLNDMVAKHQEEERISALEQSVQKLIEDLAAIQQQHADLMARVGALEQTLAQMKEQADAAVEEAKAVASKVEAIMNDKLKTEHNLEELAKITHKLTANLSNLIRK
jgi:phage shock protein A